MLAIGLLTACDTLRKNFSAALLALFWGAGSKIAQQLAKQFRKENLRKLSQEHLPTAALLALFWLRKLAQAVS